jgi:large conductance mechanosensitive channel
MKLLKGFEQFIMRGNVVDLAVGVLIGAAFGNVVKALTDDLITPLISALVGKPEVGNYTFIIHGGKFQIGSFFNATLTFLIDAAAIYFFVVLPVNALIARMHRADKPPDPTTKKCPECLSTIPIDARRCAFCTAELVAGQHA